MATMTAIMLRLVINQSGQSKTGGMQIMGITSFPFSRRSTVESLASHEPIDCREVTIVSLAFTQVHSLAATAP